MIDLVDAVRFIETSTVNGKMDIIGQRPGEKTHEMLLSDSEAAHAVKINRHFIIYPNWRSVEYEGLSQYTSDKPVSFLEVADLVSMIQSVPED